MTAPPRILLLSGPNLNMLGVREPEIYGHATLHDAEELCRKTAAGLGMDLDARQSNHEGELVGWIQDTLTTHQGIIINAGAYSHTSIAILDALKLSKRPVIEVHLTNIHAREEFRHHSYISKAAVGVICGLGIDGYAYAVTSMARLLNAI